MNTFNILIEYIKEPCLVLEIIKDAKHLELLDIVNNIKEMLKESEEAKGKKNKMRIAKKIMKYLSENLDFLRNEPKFYDEVLRKIEEFSRHFLNDKKYNHYTFIIKNVHNKQVKEMKTKIVKKKCKTVLSRGKNKGQTCNKNVLVDCEYCKPHLLRSLQSRVLTRSMKRKLDIMINSIR